MDRMGSGGYNFTGFEQMAKDIDVLYAKACGLADEGKWKEAADVYNEMQDILGWGYAMAPEKTPIREKMRSVEGYIFQKYKEKTGNELVWGEW